VAERCSGVGAGKVPGFGSGNPGDPVTDIFEPSVFAPRRIGAYYGCPYRSSTSTSASWPSGHTRLTPLFAGKTITWDRIGMIGGTNASRTIRLGVYSLDPDTLFPDALLLDAGVVIPASSAVAFYQATISLTTSATWLGAAFFMEGAGANLLFSIEGCNAMYGPYDTSPTPPAVSAALVAGKIALTASGLSSSGTMPVVGAYGVPLIPPDPSLSLNVGSNVYLRRSA